MKLKKTLSAFGVLTVAVAALASGPAAAFAADDTVGTDSVQTEAAGDMATGKLVFQTKDGKFVSMMSTTAGTFLTGSIFNTQAEAEAVSENLTIPKIGKTGPVKNAAGKCALVRTSAGSNNKFWADMKTCDGSAAQNFYWDTVNGVTGLRTGTLDKNSYVSYQPEVSGVLYFAGSTAANFVGVTGSAVVDGRLVLEAPAAGALIREDKPTFSGTSVTGASIEVLDENGDLLAPAVTVVDGKWSAVPTDALAQGRHIGTIRQVNNGMESTVPFDFTYRAVQGVSVTSPALDGTVDVARPVFTGKGEPGAQVTILNDADGNKLVDTTVDANGDWSQQSLYTLPKGAHAATATQAFNGASTTAPVRFTYETPATPVVVTTPTNGSVVDSTVVRFAGTGEPGARVVVAGATKEICSVQVGTNGSWSCDSVIDLPAGDYAFTATQTRGSNVSHAAINFTRVVKSNTAIDVKFTAPANNGSVPSLKPTFKGTGEPGAAIRVHGTTKDLATTTVKTDGTWEATSAVELTDQMKYQLTVTQTPTNQAPQSTDRVLFTVNYRMSEDVKVTTPATGSTVAEKKPVFTGTGDAGATITIAGTTKTIATAHVDEHGNWSTTSDIDLANGEYKFSVKQVGTDGEMKETAVTFTVKTTK